MNHPTSLHFSLAGVSGLELETRGVYSAAMLASGLPFVLEGKVRDGKPMSARLEFVGPPAGWSLDLTSTGCVAREDSLLRSTLEACAGMRQTPLRLIARHEEVEGEVLLTDPWHWPLDHDCWPLLAAFVLPHDGAVARLKADLGARPMSLESVFALFANFATIEHHDPEVVRTRSGTALQLIRPPWRLLSDLGRLRGAGTCLDLALFAAALLESSGRAPLLLFALDDDGYPCHAMIACWREMGQRYRPIAGRAATGNLVAVFYLRGAQNNL